MGLNFLEGDMHVFESVIKAGFDYVELPLSAISGLSAGKLAELKKALQAIPCRAANLFFPQNLTIVGPSMDIGGVNAYLERMLPLAAELGMENLVFGNGGARKIPEGSSHDSVWDNLRTVVEIMETHAAKSGIIISVEPLNHTETNIINSFGEAVDLTHGLQYVAAMIDNYHVAMENQSFDDVISHPNKLRHLHIAYPTGRMVPSPTDDMTLYVDFIKTVKQLGYDDKISIEGSLKSTAPDEIKGEIKSSLEMLKQLFNMFIPPTKEAWINK